MDIFKRSTRRRSGSLQLSINAIVILVMAMVVLGLGLTFIRGLFNKGTENLGSVLDNTKLENPANPEQPMTVDRTVTTQAGDTARLRIGFYNKWQKGSFSPQGSGSGGNLVCQGTGSNNPGVPIASPQATVSNGEATAFEAVLRVPDDTLPGTYVCTVEMVGGGSDYSGVSKQFYLEVVG